MLVAVAGRSQSCSIPYIRHADQMEGCIFNHGFALQHSAKDWCGCLPSKLQYQHLQMLTYITGADYTAAVANGGVPKPYLDALSPKHFCGFGWSGHSQILLPFLTCACCYYCATV